MEVFLLCCCFNLHCYRFGVTRFPWDVLQIHSGLHLNHGLDSIAVSLFGNMTVETGEIHIITKEYQYSIRTKDPNNHSDTETGTLSSLFLLNCF